VLDANVLFSYIGQQSQDAVTGLPVLRRLPDGLYSTRDFMAPAR